MSSFFRDEKELMDFNNKGFDIRNNYLSFKNKSFDCSYVGCNCKGVNSHTISKESSLRHISENDKLLCFIGKRDRQANITPEIQNIGINHATTFKGFCKEHEKLFKSIDLNGIKTKNDLILQIYRQVAYANYNCGILKVIDDFSEDKRLRALKELKKEVPDRILKEAIAKYKKIKFNRNEVLKECLDNFTDFINTLNETSDNLLHNETFEIEKLNMKVLFKRIDSTIPIALINDFAFNFEGNIRNCFFSVVPYKNSTDIIMAVDKIYESWANNLWEHYTKSKIDTLNFIEVVMMMSEFWFIKPSIINSMSNEKKEFLKLDIRYINEKTFKEYDFSIFDELRLEFIANEDEEIKKTELKKINSFPKRETTQMREKRLISYINKHY